MVDGEGHAVQGLGAHHAAEAAGVVRVPESLQDLRTQNDIHVSGVPVFLCFVFVVFVVVKPPPPKKKYGAGGSASLGCSCCGYLRGTNMVKAFEANHHRDFSSVFEKKRANIPLESVVGTGNSHWIPLSSGGGGGLETAHCRETRRG